MCISYAFMLVALNWKFLWNLMYIPFDFFFSLIFSWNFSHLFHLNTLSSYIKILTWYSFSLIRSLYVKISVLLTISPFTRCNTLDIASSLWVHVLGVIVVLRCCLLVARFQLGDQYLLGCLLCLHSHSGESCYSNFDGLHFDG